MLAYASDRKRARLAAPFLAEMLTRIARDLPDVKLHIIAHSRREPGAIDLCHAQHPGARCRCDLLFECRGLQVWRHRDS
jgi:hypothetical protein